MPNTAGWIHGNIVEVEAGGEVEVIRRGWGTHFLLREFDATYWFHFPIPTLAVVNNVRLKLSRVCVLFSTDGTVLRAIHVYDGPARVSTIDSLRITGDHSVEVDGENCWPVEPPVEMARGVGISVGVQISQGGRFGFPEILFTAAGAEFEDIPDNPEGTPLP